VIGAPSPALRVSLLPLSAQAWFARPALRGL